jgi:hypothetical protein
MILILNPLDEGQVLVPLVNGIIYCVGTTSLKCFCGPVPVWMPFSTTEQKPAVQGKSDIVAYGKIKAGIRQGGLNTALELIFPIAYGACFHKLA